MQITKSIKKFIAKTRSNDKHWRTYLYLVGVRFLLVFLPQLGYIHPDEFFQSTEVILGDAYGLEHTRTWEFNNTFPLRSVTLPMCLIKMPLSLMQFISLYTKYYLDIDLKNSYMYLVLPRYIMCILSFANDWSLYKVCEIYSLRYEIRLLTLSSSFVMLVFGTRTFSNSIEMAITSLLLYLVAECMIHSNTVIYKKEFLDDRYEQATSTGEKVKIWKLKNALPSHNFNRLCFMSTLCVAGVFNRPTFLIFGAPMVFFWMLRGLGTRTITFTDFNMRMFLFILSALPALCLFIIIDSFYYKYLTLGELHMLDLSLDNFVVTPWNFIKYNINSNNTAQHGVHPMYLHLLVNIPLLYNVLGITAVCSFGQMFYRFLQADYQNLPRSQSIIGLMTSAIFGPLAILTLVNHQEPRFLIPFTFPIILMHSPKLITGFCTSYPFTKENQYLRLFYNKFLCNQVSSKYLLKTWYTLNILLVIFFGFLHQAGVFPLAQHFENHFQLKPRNAQIHLVTSHIYNMPLSFVNMPSSNLIYINRETGQKYHRSREFFLHEHGSTQLPTLMSKIKLLLDVCEMRKQSKKLNYQLFLAIPASLSDDLEDAVNNMNSSLIKYDLVRTFYPHFSTEALPSLFGRHPCDLHTRANDLVSTCDLDGESALSFSFVIKQFSSLVHQFGLALYKFEIKKRKT